MSESEPNNDAATRRVFFAIEISPTIREELAQFASRLEKAALFTPARLLWVPPANYHLTLYFMGDLPVEGIERLRETTAQCVAGVVGFTSTFAALGSFPRTPRNRPGSSGSEPTGLPSNWRLSVKPAPRP
jgi:2'-5' RNA ligase